MFSSRTGEGSVAGNTWTISWCCLRTNKTWSPVSPLSQEQDLIKWKWSVRAPSSWPTKLIDTNCLAWAGRECLERGHENISSIFRCPQWEFCLERKKDKVQPYLASPKGNRKQSSHAHPLTHAYSWVIYKRQKDQSERPESSTPGVSIEKSGREGVSGVGFSNPTGVCEIPS